MDTPSEATWLERALAAAPARVGSNGAWSLLWAALTTLAQHGDGEGVAAACLPL